MSGLRAGVEAELLAWMREEPEREDEDRFERLAAALFRHQFEHCEPFRRFCEGRGADPRSVSHSSQIPAVPTGAFKELALRSFAPEQERHVFRTSGTSASACGELHLDTLEVYEASLRPSFEGAVLAGLDARAPVRLLFLAPSPEEAPDSSLSHMFGVLRATRGDEGSDFLVRAGGLEVGDTLDALEKARVAQAALALCGTAFAFVHLLDALEKRDLRLSLPGTARIMETGGFKGRSRTMDRGTLYDRIGERLGVPRERIVNQYGMTELGSQFHDTVLCRPGEPRRKLAPPWTRVRVIEPASGEEVAPGESGMIQVVDLANTGSILALLTADLGCRSDDGFEVLGRAPGAEARGCSIAADEMLGG
ncbi:MAG: long-chain fatty acid--CoA ligase [Deltaproteobacteria bacterium]|jgi:hypothetical protein|nr:long-chain fatty acid--CoA ligase [Deltaproteobacteria bacterium]